MRTFLTEYYVDDKTFAGERIYEISREMAEETALSLGLNLIGEWVEDIDEESGKITPNPNYN